jgi:hypothetical protein
LSSVASVETEGPPDVSFRTTYVLSDFLADVAARTAPVVVDLGPAVGTNVTFMGEEFACKLYIEDVLAWPADHWNDAENDGAPRLSQPDESVDGIFCWDVLDHLGNAARWALAAELSRVLRPTGVLLLYQRTEQSSHPDRLLYEIAGPSRLCVHRGPNGGPPIGKPLMHGDLRLMFRGMTATKTVLLKSRMREVLLRKSGPVSSSV